MQFLPSTNRKIKSLAEQVYDKVRKDIISELCLRDPAVYVASFNRPNLTYRVEPKTRAYGQVLDLLRARPKDSGIIYCASRAGADGLAAKLAKCS